MQFASSSYGQVQSNFSTTSQYQPVSQMHNPAVPPGETQRISQPNASGTAFHSSGEQPSIATITPTV